MAEKTEFLQAIDDAILDADSLERFINGSDTETVLTRLSAEYPTLQKAIKELLENGGIAGRFKTLAELEASSLVDGAYALVADDVDSNNGIYIKDSGLWVKSTYSPLEAAKSFTTSSVLSIVGLESIPLTFGSESYAVVALGTGSLFAEGGNRKYIKIDVSDYRSVKISGANSPTDLWRWVIADENLTERILVTDFWNDGEISIPDGGTYLLRTFKASGIEEAGEIVLTGSPKSLTLSDIDSRVSTLNADAVKKEFVTTTAHYEIISGGVANTFSGEPVTERADGKYIKVDVEGVSQLIVSGAKEDISAWKWVFEGYNGERIYTTAEETMSGNGTLNIPNNVKYALRTYEVANLDTFENKDIQIDAVVFVDSLIDIYRQLEEVKNSAILSYKSTAEKLIKDSGLPVVKVSDFTGTSSSQKINNALNYIKLSGGAVLDLESGLHLIDSALLLPSNCWLYLNDATLKLKDGVFDNIIRNDGIVPNADPFEPATELNENRNIRIFGNSPATSQIQGPDIPYKAPHPVNGGTASNWVGDFYGWRTVPILLANVKGYTIHDFKLSKTTCWAISQEHGCDDFEVYNIEFDTNVKNGDGVDLRMGCSNGRIYNITGKTADDMVALSCIKDYITQHPKGSYVYPMQVGGYGDRGLGTSISNITISNIKGKGSHNGVRLLASGGGKLNNIKISDISDRDGKFGGSVLVVSSGYGTPAVMGDVTNIFANDINSNESTTALKLGGNLKDCVFNKVTQENVTGAAVDDTSNKDNVVISNVSDA